MTSLAIAESIHTSLSPLSKAEFIRDNAIWFPDIPKQDLHWNESCFKDNITTGFKPLCYILFTDAPEISRISEYRVNGNLLAINFHYGIRNVCRLGPQFIHPSRCRSSYFTINGKDGEIITAIKIYKYKGSISFAVCRNFIFHEFVRC
jgi:hypothetical protein